MSQYGLEFKSAVVSDDAESAIVYMGEMAHPVCNLACDNLPGVWHMSTMNDLGLVWDEVTTSNNSIWVGSSPHDVNPTSPFAYYVPNGDRYITSTPGAI